MYMYNKCDVICENLPYGGTDIASPGQTDREIRGVLYGPTIFVANEHLQLIQCQSLCSVNLKYYHKCVNNADKGWHCLFFHHVGFRR